MSKATHKKLQTLFFVICLILYNLWPFGGQGTLLVSMVISIAVLLSLSLSKHLAANVFHLVEDIYSKGELDTPKVVVVYKELNILGIFVLVDLIVYEYFVCQFIKHL